MVTQKKKKKSICDTPLWGCHQGFVAHIPLALDPKLYICLQRICACLFKRVYLHSEWACEGGRQGFYIPDVVTLAQLAQWEQMEEQLGVKNAKLFRFELIPAFRLWL